MKLEYLKADEDGEGFEGGEEEMPEEDDAEFEDEEVSEDESEGADFD